MMGDSSACVCVGAKVFIGVRPVKPIFWRGNFFDFPCYQDFKRKGGGGVVSILGEKGRTVSVLGDP